MLLQPRAPPDPSSAARERPGLSPTQAPPDPPPLELPPAPGPRSATGAPQLAEAPARPAPSGQPAGAGAALFGGLVRLGQGFQLGEALEKNAESADRNVERFCEEARKHRERSPMPEPATRERDAAAFLAPLVDWQKPLDDPPGRLHLSAALLRRIASYGDEWWPTRPTAQDLTGLDFSWMERLLEFDHWSLLGAGPLKDYPVGDFYHYPIPDYVSLQYWVKLRFALALQRGDFAAASKQVRHLGDLIRSQGTLVSDMIALVLYKIDTTARARAAAAGQDVSSWPAADPAEIDRERPLAFSALYFTYPGVSAETLRKAVACAGSPCSTLFEAVGANRSFGAYGSTDNLSLVQQLAADRNCEAALFERIAKSNELSASDLFQAQRELQDSGGGEIPRLLDLLH